MKDKAIYNFLFEFQGVELWSRQIASIFNTFGYSFSSEQVLCL